MGRDIHVKILIKEEDKWKEVTLYNKVKDNFEEIEVYPYLNYLLFDILNETEDNLYNIARPISLEKLPKEIKKDIEEKEKIPGYYGFKEVNLADLKLYLKTIPTTEDDYHTYHGRKLYNINPVKYFIERIEQYIDFAIDPWDLRDSDVKILYWFDW